MKERSLSNKYEYYLCSKLFSREIILENHISVVHDGNADHKCENCSKTLSSQHLRKHINKEQCKVDVDENQKVSNRNLAENHLQLFTTLKIRFIPFMMNTKKINVTFVIKISHP